MSKKVTRRISWFCWHGLFIALTIWGVMLGVKPFANVLKFLIWLTALLMIVAAISESGRNEIRKVGPSMPVMLTLAVDLVIACLLAAYGWFGYAALLITSSICSVVPYLNNSESGNKE